MRLGIHLPVVNAQGEYFTAEGVMERARAIEDAGFDSIWLGDHIGSTRPDPLMWLLVAAAATKRVEVGTAILQLPLRNPVELAQRCLTLQALTRGRFCVGVGSGSSLRSFDAVGLGDQFERRFKTMQEDLDTITALCNGEQVGSANLQPAPGGGCPPIVVGAWGSGVWVKKAAEKYQGWMASGGRTNLTTLGEGIKRYRDFGGKRALVATIITDLSQPEGPMEEDSPELRGDLAVIGTRYNHAAGFTLLCGPKSAAERLAKLAELGFDDALLVQRSPVNIYGDMTLEQMATLRSLLPRDTRPQPWET